LAVAAVNVFGVWSELTVAGDRVPAPAAGGYAFAVLAGAVLVARRRRPVLVALATMLVTFAYHLSGYPGEAPGFAMFVAFYSVAAYGKRMRSLAACGALVLLAQLIPTLPPNRIPWTSFAVLGPAFGMAWMVVLGAAARQRRLAALERVRQAASRAESDLRERLAEERLRIARELHDVLAHTISVIAVQSGLALDSIDADPARARTALQRVRAAAREAMPELRAALGLLRGDGQGNADLVPQPGLAQLADLAEQARLAGLRVDLTLPEPDTTTTPLLGLTAYRIVQEALTNVVRHAGAGTVTVDVRRDGTMLSIEVRDDGRGTSAGTGTGLGIAGMRERASLVGGDLSAGPAKDGGFQVRATLPLETV
jgi:signal transduction histidine kinase